MVCVSYYTAGFHASAWKRGCFHDPPHCGAIEEGVPSQLENCRGPGVNFQRSHCQLHFFFKAVNVQTLEDPEVSRTTRSGNKKNGAKIFNGTKIFKSWACLSSMLRWIGTYHSLIIPSYSDVIGPIWFHQFLSQTRNKIRICFPQESSELPTVAQSQRLPLVGFQPSS